MTRFAPLTRALGAALVAAVLVAPPPAVAAPEGQLTWGVHITLIPTYFDPADTPGLVTPFMILYALHDALVKPMPGRPATPSLAESWTVSKDGLVYDFVLRRGVKFHTGEEVTAEDVKFSFDRYRGAAATLLHSKVALRRAGQRAESARAQAAPGPGPADHRRAGGLHPRDGLGVHQRRGEPARGARARPAGGPAPQGASWKITPAV
jgi:ABC-type transport system substrate-binding protein